MVEASLGGDAVRTIDPGTAVPRRTLPSGMVTFVFTDIEGSTRLLRRWGSQYEELLERHRDILRAAWNEHRGCEIGAEGASDHALVFSARVGERKLDGCDFLHTNEHGLIDDMCVMVRPLSGALALAEAMKAELLAAQGD